MLKKKLFFPIFCIAFLILAILSSASPFGGTLSKIPHAEKESQVMGTLDEGYESRGPVIFLGYSVFSYYSSTLIKTIFLMIYFIVSENNS